MTTIILGAGIVGTSTAYYLSLSKSPLSIHLVETSPTLFASASGFAGGFLAKDWFSPAVSSLGEFSFLEHKRLAEEHDGKRHWGYSKSSTMSYNPQRDVKPKRSGVDWLRHGASRAEAVAGSLNELTSKDHAGPKWFTRIVGDVMEVISEEGSTAQV
jgi:glycine/D-amino acid oxidase-like deaminating enzyme